MFMHVRKVSEIYLIKTRANFAFLHALSRPGYAAQFFFVISCKCWKTRSAFLPVSNKVTS